ncbi:MAG TPA: redoxin domain-containing protein [Anaerolineae bacterium]|nr:redoxin domain-containing protein [Anaerolineae bacterium]
MVELHTPIVRAPDFAPGVWINSPPLHIDALRGRVVLIDIWDFTCINCLRTLPYLVEWHRRYAGRGLTIVGVHSPEFEFAKDRRQVEAAARRFGLNYPIVLDNEYATWTAYANRYWPAHYLIDRNGYIRYTRFGEGGYYDFEQAIQQLLREIDPAIPLPEPMPALRPEDRPGAVCHRITPELYTGFDRGALGNPEGYRLDAVMFYPEPERRPQGQFYAAGPWKAARDHLAAAGASGALILPYQAATVNAVLSPSGDPVELMLGIADANAAPLAPVDVVITQNEQPLTPLVAGDDIIFDEHGRSCVRVDAPRMYNLVKNPTFGRFELRLMPGRAGFAIYAFTFTSCVVPDSAQDGPGLLFVG